MGLYYLQSRYYNPEIGRFISPDSIDYIDPESINGLNLYAYCANNPVMYIDPSGHFAVSLGVALLATLVISTSASAVSQGVQYGWDNINLLQVGVDGLFGMASVALAATGIGLGASIALGGTMGFGQYAIASGLHNEQITIQGALVSIGIGAISGAISNAGARNFKAINNSLAAADVGGTGIRAITTAANKYAAGEITKKGLQGTLNIFAKSTAQAVQLAIPGIIAKNFTSSAVKIMITSAVAPWAGILINNSINQLRLMF